VVERDRREGNSCERQQDANGIIARQASKSKRRIGNSPRTAVTPVENKHHPRVPSDGVGHTDKE
jgi:hypothetical protein